LRAKRILLDIETQNDFFRPGGSCYSKKSRVAARNVRALFRWAKACRMPVISTVLRVRRSQIGPLAKVPHCLEGTEGEKKLTGTVLPRRINLGLRNTTDLPPDLLRDYQQVIIEKRSTDIFLHDRLERLVTELPPAVFVICGAGVAHGIVQAAVGLHERGFGVIVVEDAVLDLGDPLAEMAYRRMEAKGVVFAPTAEITTPVRRRPKVRPFRVAARAEEG